MIEVPVISSLMQSGTPPINITVSSGTDWPTTIIAILGLVLAILSLGLGVYTWRGSGSRVRVETSLRIFPGVARDQMMALLTRIQQPPEMVSMAQQMIQYQSQFSLPRDLGYPASAELIAVVPPETVLVVATITNTGRLPVTIQRCQWQTSQPDMLVEAPDTPPGVSLPHRLAEHDGCISVISLATIMAILDAPLRDKSVTGREAWPIVVVANRKKPIRGNSLVIPTRSLPQTEQTVGA